MRTSSIFNSQHVATRCNRVAKRTQHVAPTMLQSVALKCCDRLAGACKCWASIVGICCVETLLSFGRGLKMDGKHHQRNKAAFLNAWGLKYSSDIGLQNMRYSSWIWDCGFLDYNFLVTFLLVSSFSTGDPRSVLSRYFLTN